MATKEKQDKPPVDTKANKTEKVSWLPVDSEEHQKQFQYAEDIEFINRLQQPLSVIVSTGGRDFKHHTGASGRTEVRKDTPDVLKGYPGLQMRLAPKEHRHVKVPLLEVLFLSTTLMSLLRDNRVRVRRKVKGEFKNLSYAELNQLKAAYFEKKAEGK